MDPQQELFTKIIEVLREKGYAVYEGALPPEGTPYPYVYMGETQQLDDTLKNAVVGNIFQTIHVWHNNVKQRGVVSGMLLDIKNAARRIEHTKNFAFDVANVDQRIRQDETTAEPLMHGVLEIEFTFS